MATPQETKRDAMSKVNGVMAAIDFYPQLSPTNSQFSFSASRNPIDLLVDFFKTTKGYDWLIDTVSNFIAKGLPALELAVKAVLLSNIKTMLSCSVNPIITQNMINNGIVIDLNRIDLLNIFSYSPLNKKQDNPGKYYYFGCDVEDGIEIIDDLKNSRDFNAVLWYAKNTPGERIVWRRENDLDKSICITRLNDQEWTKQVKSDGIATIEFNGRSSGLRKADGSAYYIQEPIDNCLHVFIGYCLPKKTDSKKDEISECTQLMHSFNVFDDTIVDYIKKVNDFSKNSKIEAKQRGASAEEFNKIDRNCNNDLHILRKLQYALYGVDIDNPESTESTVIGIMHSTQIELNTLHEVVTIPSDLLYTNTNTVRNQKIFYMEQDAASYTDYPSPKSNYYYLHPLFEWNTDFIMSIKLLDEKVITAQLLEALTNSLSFSASFTLNAQMQFVQEQIRELTKKIIENDDGVVSDCFFSFSNDSYNAMLNEVELNKMRMRSVNSNTINSIPSSDDILESLNTLSHDATKEELKSVINNSLLTVTNNTLPGNTKKQWNITSDFNVNFSIIDNLLESLVYVLVSTVLQPKVYTLLMVNLTVLGNEPNFDLSKFMQQFGDLISGIIKEIKDHILEYFTDELIKILQELVKTLAIKLSTEQYQYYITLLTHCIQCLQLHKGEFDWTQDDVNYADITELNETEKQEC